MKMSNFLFFIFLVFFSQVIYTNEVNNDLFSQIILVKQESDRGEKFTKLLKFDFDKENKKVIVEFIVEEKEDQKVEFDYYYIDNKIVIYYENKDSIIYTFYFENEWKIITSSTSELFIIGREDRELTQELQQDNL